MANARPSIRYGRIVFAWIEDRNGYGKLRPAAILTSDEEIPDAEKLVVAAITTTFADPPPPFCVPIPWHPRGHPVTHLNQRSAVVTNWLAMLATDNVVGFAGDVRENNAARPGEGGRTPVDSGG
ncbi:MAG: mRNA interferase MazF [Phycisphaerales bacterium]|nr:mRNA interferase MazF [Phycisphaerales bacterium]